MNFRFRALCVVHHVSSPVPPNIEGLFGLFVFEIVTEILAASHFVPTTKKRGLNRQIVVEALRKPLMLVLRRILGLGAGKRSFVH